MYNAVTEKLLLQNETVKMLSFTPLMTFWIGNKTDQRKQPLQSHRYHVYIMELAISPKFYTQKGLKLPHRYRRGHGFESRSGLIFFRL